jgi:hypothetical protein
MDLPFYHLGARGRIFPCAFEDIGDSARAGAPLQKGFEALHQTFSGQQLVGMQISCPCKDPRPVLYRGFDMSGELRPDFLAATRAGCVGGTVLCGLNPDLRGRSNTWRVSYTSGSTFPSSQPQPQAPWNSCSTTWSGFSTGSNVYPLCAFCPPGLRLFLPFFLPLPMAGGLELCWSEEGGGCCYGFSFARQKPWPQVPLRL